MKKLTSLQLSCLEYFYRQSLGLPSGNYPQIRVRNTLYKKGFLLKNEWSNPPILTEEALRVLLEARPDAGLDTRPLCPVVDINTATRSIRSFNYGIEGDLIKADFKKRHYPF
jgi:hypothetical protein